jgi:hypothetical protein
MAAGAALVARARGGVLQLDRAYNAVAGAGSGSVADTSVDADLRAYQRGFATALAAVALLAVLLMLAACLAPAP